LIKMPDWAGIHEDRKTRASYLPLALMSFAYEVAVLLRLNLFNYDRAKALPGFTVSIGNLTAGGTGKTPATKMIAEWAVEEGHNVAILSRGYGGSPKKKIFIVSDGSNTFGDPSTAGDEAYLLANSLKGIPVVVSKNRHLAGLEAHNRFGSSFFILDDGYQHLGLKRDFNLLLLDAASPFGNGRLLPRGPLREPVAEIKRADAVILTRAGALENGGDKTNGLKKMLMGKPSYSADHVPEKIIFAVGGGTYTPAFLKGKRVAAFAGIARPDFFRHTLMRLGADISCFKAFPDHHYFTKDEIGNLIVEKNNAGADLLITTEKDWVRAAPLIPEGQPAAYLTVRFDILNEKDRFFSMIRELIVRKAAQ
jgi:tetraacyldisaccharide 4'-kinase